MRRWYSPSSSIRLRLLLFGEDVELLDMLPLISDVGKKQDGDGGGIKFVGALVIASVLASGEPPRPLSGTSDSVDDEECLPIIVRIEGWLNKQS